MNRITGLIVSVTLLLILAFPVNALVLISDNFERQELGTDWTVVIQTWSIEEGELKAEGVDALLSSGQYCGDASIEVKAKIIDYGPGTNYWVGLIARATNPNDDCWTSGYLVYLRYDGRIELYTYEDSVIAWAQTGITPEEFVTIKATFIGSIIKVYVNGFLYLDIDHNRYSGGYFSLKSYVAEAHFDDVLVENPVPSNAVPEPAPIIISLLFAAVFAAYVLVRYRKPSLETRI